MPCHSPTMSPTIGTHCRYDMSVAMSYRHCAAAEQHITYVPWPEVECQQRPAPFSVV